MSLTTLLFSVDNPSNTTIYEESQPDRIAYTVITTHDNGGEETVTTVLRGGSDGYMIATLAWHETLSDMVTLIESDGLGSGKSKSLSSWMKKSWVPFKRYVLSGLEDWRKEGCTS